MLLSSYELIQLMKEFPNIELSYEKNIHKKVPSSNLYLTIPKGKKYFTWFRHWKKYDVCIFMELDRHRKQIQAVSIKNVCFDNMLCSGKGTIFYGTLFNVNTYNFFNIEDIFFFKGNNISLNSQYAKFNILHTICTNYIKPVIITKHDVAFGLPLINTNRDTLYNKIQELPYEIYCIQHRLLHKRSTFLNERVNIVNKHECIFLIKATIFPDIYELYYKKDKNVIFYNHACIPDYKTSVYMNNIFRNIKENKNLDALEESDDDEEFENISDDKFVDLNKEECFRCIYLKYYKSWKPIEQTCASICTENDILDLRK